MSATPNNEFLANDGNTASSQNTYPGANSLFDSDLTRSMRSIAMKPNGEFIVVWSSYRQDNGQLNWGVYGRVYNPDGTPKGNAFLINEEVRRNQVAPSVAIDADGGYIVTWSSNFESFDPGKDDDGYGVFARRFDANGQAIGGEFLVNTLTGNNQLSSVVAADQNDDPTNPNDGGFVITWTDQFNDGDQSGIFARRYDRLGQPQGDAFAVTNAQNGSAAGNQLNSTVAMADDGSFVVVWESSTGERNSQGGAGTGYGIFAQRYDAQGNAQGNPFQINAFAEDEQRKPSVAIAADGSFVVAWSSKDQLPGSGWDVFYRRYNRDGTPATGELRANADFTGNQQDAMVSIAPNGTFLITWTTTSTSANGVYARRFDASGNPLGGTDGNEFRLDTGTKGTGKYSSIAASDTSFAAVWTGDDITIVNGSPQTTEGVVGRSYTVSAPTGNTPPTNIALTPASGTVLQVAENDRGAVIGTLSAQDAEGNAITYTVSGDNRFEIVGNQLKLKGNSQLGDSLNFEDSADGLIDLTITATDNGTPSPASATRVFRIRTGNPTADPTIITLVNVNEAPAGIALSNNRLNENSPAGTVVGVLSATDPEGNAISYSIANNPLYELRNGNEIIVKAGATLNFEDPASRFFDLTVTATDNGNPSQSSNQTFRIELQDVNEVPGTIALVANPVNENVPAATIGTVTVTDPDGTIPNFDVSDNRFEIVNPTLVNGVVNATLKLKQGEALNYEALQNGQLTLDIIAIDSQNPALQSRQSVTFEVTNVNEPPVSISLTGNQVTEDVPGAIVGQVSFLDPENSPQNLTVSDSRFEIDAQNNLKLRAGVALDREAAETIQLKIRAADQANANLFTEQEFTITVQPNLPPDSITLTANPIDENVEEAVIGTLTAIDPNGTTPILSVTDPRFEIVNNSTLKLKQGQSLDYERLVGGKLSLEITATDSQDPAKRFSRNFEITVNNVNEAPIFIDIPDTGSVANNAPGAVIDGEITFSDPEGDPVQLSVDDPRFEVVQINNQWRLKLKDGSSLIFDPQNSSVTVNVIATDGRDSTLQTSRPVVVSVVEPGTPTGITLSKSTIDEATPEAIVGIVTVQDPDSTTHTFTLSDPRFEIVQVNGQYQLKLRAGLPAEQIPDFETANGDPIPLNITARDSDGREVTRSFQIRISNINEAPTAITLSDANVDEQQNGAIVGAIAVTDPDVGDSFIFNVSDPRFEVRNGNLKLIDTTSLDINDGTTITLTVTATDSGSKSIQQQFTLTVDPVNFAPTDITLSKNTIDEDTEGAIVGKVTAVDPDRTDTHTFTVDNDLRFEVDPAGNLRLKTGQKIDYETEQTINLTITATDNGTPQGKFTKQNIQIQVNNLNDAPVLSFPSGLSVAENTPEAVIGTLTATDPENNPLTYEITGALANLFAIDTSTGVTQLKLKPGASLNFESPDLTNDAVILFITASDNGTPVGTTRLEVRFAVTDVNEAPTALNLLGSRTVTEQVPGATIGTLTVTDPDRPQVERFRYEVDDTRFEVDPQGNLKLKAGVSLDAGVAQKITVRVTAFDREEQPVSQSFEITVVEQNLPPTEIRIDKATVDEDTPGAIVGKLSAIDPDSKDTHTFEVNDTRFVVDSQGNLKLNLGESIDFEQEQEIVLRVTAKDSGNPQQSFSQDIRIQVNDLNDAPVLQFTPAAPSIAENAAGVTIGTFSVSDAENNQVNLSVSGDPDNRFEIAGNQIRLKAGASLDYEALTNGSLTLKLIATDNGNQPKTTELSIPVTVTNVPEAPTVINLSATEINEGIAADSAIATLSTVDPDRNETFTYQLVSGFGDHTAFRIDGNQLRIRQSPDFETKSSYQLQIISTDRDGLSTAPQTFTITVRDLNEPPTDITLSSSTVAENAAGAIIGNVSVTDPDSNQFTFTVSDNRFEVVRVNNLWQLKLKNGQSLDFEAGSPLSIAITAKDNGTPVGELTKSFPIIVTNVNEAPSAIQLSNDRVAENAPGAIIGDLIVTNADISQLTFTVSDPTRFEVQNGKLKLKAGQSLNYEELQNGRLSLGITATSSGNAAESFTQQLTINVTDVNEAPTAIGLSNNRVPENTPGATVGQLQVTDPDQGDRFTYRVSDPRFEVDPQGNLKLKPNQQLDREATPEITLSITAIDRENLETTQSLTLQVTDVNEAPISLTLDGNRVDENAPPNTLIGTFKATDNEGGRLVYSLVPGVPDNDAFLIVGDRLLVKNPLDFETKSKYSIRVAVTDADGLSLTQNFEIDVTNANEAPILTPDAGTLAYPEDADAVAIDPTLNLVDPDSQILTGATIRLVNFVPDQDSLSFVPPANSGITGQFDAATGTLTLQGSASISAYQNALRSIAYTNSSNAPNTTNRTVQISVSDSALTSRAVTRTIQITPSNDAPIVTPSVSTVSFSLEERAIELDALLSISDVDSTTLNGATIALEGYVAGEDNLIFNDQNGIVGSFNAAGGVLTLTGTASLDSYQQALRSVLYLNSSQQPTAQLRSAVIRVSDGTASDPVRLGLQFQPSVASPIIDLNGSGAGNDFSNTFVVLGQPVTVASGESRLTDADSRILSRAEVRITNLFDSDSEMLLADTTGTSITARYDRATGTLSLTGDASLNDYIEVMRRIRYQNTSAAPNLATRVILFRVSDGTRFSNAAQTTIQMTDIRLNDGTGTGDPTLVTTPATDRINAQDGNDTVRSTLANLQQNDLIDGGTGIDTLILTDGTGNARIEIANPTQQVSGILNNNTIITSFEQFNWSGFLGNITLVGSSANDIVIAGSGADILSGGSGDDRLIGNAGNDRLDGGAGADYLGGGAGDDFYLVESPGDLVIESENGGFDTLSAAIDYMLPTGVEDLILTGGALNGTGNALENTLTGNRLNNTLSGGLGDDVLIGNEGNDRLVGESDNDELIGGLGSDRLLGGDGNDRLEGSAGRDRLTGGAGKDTFILTSSMRSNHDVITDFNAKDDTILISRRSFGWQLRRGRVRANQFVIGNRAQDANDRFIYSRGSLFFDLDGIGNADQILIARLGNRPTITRSDLRIQ